MYNIDSIKDCVIKCADEVKKSQRDLEVIDSQSGDGDLGISMEKGFSAIQNIARTCDGNDVGAFFQKCGMAFNKAAPSTMGTLISFSFLRLSKTFSKKECLSIEDIYSIPQIFADSIMQSGKAHEGDRTILDSLLPVCRAFEQAKNDGRPLAETLYKAKLAGIEGAEKTKTLVPKIGRAKWAPNNATGVVDGGAMLCVIVMSFFSDYCRA